MNLEGSYLVLGLTVLIQVFFGLALETRSLVRSTVYFAIQAWLLVLTYIVYAVYVPNPHLFIWAGVCAVLTGLLLPFFRGGLLYSARHMPADSSSSPVGTIVYVVLAVLALLIIGSRAPLTLAGSALGPGVSVNLLGALLLFVYGAVALLSHRHPFKMVLGLMMMTEGAHLALVQLTPGQLEVVKIGVLTQVIPSIFMVLYVNRLIAEKLKVTDTVQLSDLKH